MHVVVLGAGVAGIASAYSLSAKGYDVTVVERADEVAAGTSFANGGQLSYSFTDALARPSFLPGIPGLLLSRDPAIRVRLLTQPSVLCWGLRFLGQCTTRKARDNTVAVLQLAMRSANRLAMIEEQTGIEFAHAPGGKLVMLPANADLSATEKTIALKKRHGCETSLLTVAEASTLEPAVADLRGDYAGALHSAHDEVGDSRIFAAALASWLCANRGVNLRLSEVVSGINVSAGRTTGVLTSGGTLQADAVVVCLGAESPAVLRGAGISAPIYPVRGYSMTMPRAAKSPSISITDLRRRILYCPLGGKMRVSGFADFVGSSGRDDPRRIALLRKIARETAPQAADYNDPDYLPWAGSRPMTPNGRPLCGATAVPGLFVNCGHGMLGWTLAAATGHDVSEAVARAS